MTTTLKPCPCGYTGALAGMDNGTHLSLSCPECSREVEAFTLEGLAEAWNAPPSAAGGPVQLTVWYGPMPESNGKSNYTAVLMRKGASLFDGLAGGITIERSEYPDRVLYEADRMRYLIGELDAEPDILAYDPDAHSGYVRPTPTIDELVERFALYDHPEVPWRELFAQMRAAGVLS